ncbi:MAG TPA: S8 family serine peptidase, partial [Catenuloplanes sp.]
MTTTLGVLIAAASLTGATAANAAPSGARAGSPAPADPLGGHDLRLLAEAKAAGRTAVTLIVATDRGEAKAVADRLTALGGSVSRRFDRTGYVLASVPTASVVAAAGLPGIAAVDLDEQIALPDPGLQTRSATPDAAADAVPAPGPDTPAVNPYLPTHEIGVVDFVRRHPTYDGRGVTIGIMDSGVDLDNPALQTTSTGERKIVNWVTATDPVLDGLLAGDGTWRDMVTRGVGPRFTALGATWTAPAGDWRISDFREDFTGNAADYAGDVNRDGDDTDVFGVLYDPVSHDIRVDTDQDRDFTNNPVLRPYREKYDVGHFGVDNPATEVRERVPFVVEYREDVDLSALGGDNKGKKTDFVNIGIVDSSHGSHVAGISAGNNMFDNANFDGAAPG